MSDENITKLGAGHKVTLSRNGTIIGDALTNSEGYYEIWSDYGFVDTDVLTVFIDQDTYDGVTIVAGSINSIYNGGSVLNGVDIYADHLILRSINATTVDNTHVVTAGTTNDSDIDAIFTTGVGDVINGAAGKHLYIWPDVAARMDANATIGGNLYNNDGSYFYVVNGATVSVAGSFEARNGSTAEVETGGFITVGY